jgi:hypothetical protein
MDRRTSLLATRAPGWSILIRLLVGLVVFLSEGIEGAGAWSPAARLAGRRVAAGG